MKFALPVMLLLLAAGAPQDDPFDHAVDALAAGSAATRTGDTKELRRAVVDLRASGAMPLTGGEDVARSWSRRARLAPPSPYRNRVLGPGYRAITLDSAGVWRLEQTFLAGQRARVAVVTAPSGSFSLQITNGDRESVCRASPSHRQCDWIPDYTARFSIEVRNPGRLPGHYFIVMQ